MKFAIILSGSHYNIMTYFIIWFHEEKPKVHDEKRNNLIVLNIFNRNQHVFKGTASQVGKRIQANSDCDVPYLL